MLGAGARRSETHLTAEIAEDAEKFIGADARG